jgi:pimeloyl-ACP methyl ester carboxylesterase
LQANVRLTSAAQMGRDLGSLIEPALLRDNPDVVQPLEFTTSRGSNPGLSGLELYNVADHTVITPEHPLVIRVPAPETREVNAVAEEHVLPIGYDGEFFLPLGRAIKREGAIEIALERLPAPLSFPIAGERSLTGSIRIMFKKILHRPLGLRYAYPILAVADVAADGTVDYIADSDKVASRVAAANRIVLYIHGIIGDTRDMAASVRCPGFPAEAAPPALADNYDLILTFDYENINTRIQDTAQLLKERLQALGLGEGHGKTLHIIAHSMGGLVSRWFIENLGGNQSVQHLIMLGTPNDGSPWPRLQDWATATLAIGLNALPVLGWPANVLGVLVGAIEKADVALDQMAPGSDFLVDLSRSPAPGIPYTIIAGNTSIISAALQSPEGAEQSIAARLMKRVLSQNTLHQLTDMAFFGEPNDIAVKVESITKVSGERSVAPSVYEVECDHLTYFSSEAGIRALQESIV